VATFIESSEFKPFLIILSQMLRDPFKMFFASSTFFRVQWKYVHLKKIFMNSLKANILANIIYVLSHRPTLTAIDISSFSLLGYFDDFEIHSNPFSNIRQATMLVFTKEILAMNLHEGYTTWFYDIFPEAI
jgi:hypothetical protein